MVIYDNQRYDNLDGAFVGFNGFANLIFVGSKLAASLSAAELFFALV